ncbi:hypothetical protein BVY03_02905 [bacterium K02(2017)]|nr:hypothetical protein BVY03_02905 [bacterium K02(2017)]
MLETFIKNLKKSPKKSVFNPWWDIDPENDLNKNGPKIRRQQLTQYIKERQGKIKYLLLGEALGYQGGHFTGIAMTSERILLDQMHHKGITAKHIFKKLSPQRTSNPKIKENGFTEPTATIVWGFMVQNNIDPNSFLIWNAFPWHPFHQNRGILSNRTPKPDEFSKGLKILHDLIKLSGPKKIIAIGEKAHLQLNEMGIKNIKVRHPANGGAGKFRNQMLDIIEKN